MPCSPSALPTTIAQQLHCTHRLIPGCPLNTHSDMLYDTKSALCECCPEESEQEESHLGIIQFVMPALLSKGLGVGHTAWLQHSIQVYIHQVVVILHTVPAMFNTSTPSSANLQCCLPCQSQCCLTFCCICCIHTVNIAADVFTFAKMVGSCHMSLTGLDLPGNLNKLYRCTTLAPDHKMAPACKGKIDCCSERTPFCWQRWQWCPTCRLVEATG